ncbi:MAG: GatB/YqeY domain-containing protein [Gemmatimonas sp.]
MPLRTDLSDALKDAMRSKDEAGVSTLRMILAGLKDRDIAARTKGTGEPIPDPEILDLLQRMVKQRQESIEMYKKGNRPDLVAKEEAEIAVIERFMPKQLTDAEMEQVVAQTVSRTGATSIRDMGKVIAALREEYAGRMDFGRASQLVKARLSA